jgi:hypothetical protein
VAHQEDAGNVVMAMYRPKPGKDDALRALIARHVPRLRELGLATCRPAALLQAADGTYIEIFEWKPGGAHAAHSNAGVLEIWNAFASVSDFVRLADIAESQRPFAHFRPVEGVTV